MTCPTLHVLRGTLTDGREPRHALDQYGVCRFCHRTIR